MPQSRRTATQSPKIIAFSGAQGTGKTTAAYHRAALMKQETPHKRIGVIAENIIDCPCPVNRAGTRTGQLWIFTDMIRREIEMMKKYDIIVSDRACIDAIAYTRAMGFNDLAAGMLDIARIHAACYRRIFLRTCDANPYNYKNGLRDTDDAFRLAVEQELKTIITQLNLDRTVTVI